MLPELELPREQRMLRRLTAWALGYFWLPCPCCGRHFAGFEVGDRHLQVDGVSLMACRWCDDCPGAAREQATLALQAGEDVARAVAEAGGRLVLVSWGAADYPAEWRCGP